MLHIPCSAPSTSETARRIPDRRRRLFLSYVLSFYPRANPTHDLIRNGADGCSHLAHVDLLPWLRTLSSDDDRFVTRLHVVESGDVNRHHVHRNRANDRHSTAPNQDVAASLEPEVKAVGVAGRDDGDRRWRGTAEARAVPDGLAGPQSLYGDDAAG